MQPGAPDRLVALDLIRGVAVLGILAINIAGFAGPPLAVSDPAYPPPGTQADLTAYTIKFLLFEGKMRALFTMLFGASMILFIERADAGGRFGDHLQLRRLGWLMLFGLTHFYLIWWGDILFLYGSVGVIALMMRDMPVRTLATIALVIFVLWHAIGTAVDLADVLTEHSVLMGAGSSEEVASYFGYLADVEAFAAMQRAAYQGGYLDQLALRTGELVLDPFTGVIVSAGETLPLMLIGMALYRSGFFSGGWNHARLLAAGIGCAAAGLAMTLGVFLWLMRNGFPVEALDSAYLNWLAVPHLLMAFGYAALLTIFAVPLGRTAIGRRLIAAGRMAFTNYLATSIVMTGIFYGWGLGLAGTVGHAGQWAFVLFGWLLMLAWSLPWLSRYRRGPLEWAWASLIEKRIISNRT